MLRAIKQRLYAMAPSAVFLAITYYFGWNAIHGKSGLEAQAVQRSELAGCGILPCLVGVLRTWDDRRDSRVRDAEAQGERRHRLAGRHERA